MKQGTGVVGELCKDVFIPKMVKVHQKFDLSYIKPEVQKATSSACEVRP